MTIKLRLLGAALMLLMLSTLAPPALAVTPADYDAQQPQILEEGHLYAESAFLFDMDTGEILLSKDSRVRRYPASTTKIMTCLLALESGIGLDDTVTIPKEAGDVPEGSSVIGIKPGDTMTWRDLLYGLMLRSGNDASNAIAVLCAGSIDAFVKRMNARAAELHCEGTHFVNAHGYHDSDHYTTAQDLARMAYAAMQNETFRQLAAAPHWELTVTRKGKTASTDAENRNLLVVPDSKYYYPYATGIKTGHHNKSGRCVVATAEKTGIRLMAVVMDTSNEEKQFTDAKKLFEYGFSRYAPYTMRELLGRLEPELCVVSIDNAAEDDPSGGRLYLRFGEISGGEVTRMIQRDSDKAMSLALEDVRSTLNVEWTRALVAPISAGEVMGAVRFDAPDGTEVTATLVANADIAAQPTPSPTPEPTPTPTPTPTPKAKAKAKPTKAANDDRQDGSASESDTDNHRSDGAPIGLLVAAALCVGLSVTLLAALKARSDRRRRARRRAAERRRRAGTAQRRNGNVRRGGERRIDRRR